MWDRKLLSLLVTAANNTLAKSLSGGRLTKGMRPGIISLMQTHSGTMDWNCHLHLVVTNGLVDYTDPALPKFKQCPFWDIDVMTEMFRLELLTLMVKRKVLPPEVADNLMSWQNSGFHVYATDPFDPADTQTLTNRLAYAYRLPAPLNRLSFTPSTGHRDGNAYVDSGGFHCQVDFAYPQPISERQALCRVLLVEYPTQGEAGQTEKRHPT